MGAHKSTNTSYWPYFRHWASRRWGFSGLSLHSRVSVNSIFPAFTLGIQWYIWRCVADLHSCLWCGHDHRWWWYRSHRSLHWNNRCHGSRLSGHGTMWWFTAVVHRGVHSCVNWLPGCRLWWQRAHSRVEVPMGFLGGGGKPTLPPWYPAELPWNKEGDPKEGQATGSHYQWQQTHRYVWKERTISDSE